eukprot:4369988-Lingulodinium_polyedra.AAC.1
MAAERRAACEKWEDLEAWLQKGSQRREKLRLGCTASELSFGPGPAGPEGGFRFWAADGAAEPGPQHFATTVAVDGSMCSWAGEHVKRAGWAVVE